MYNDLHKKAPFRGLRNMKKKSLFVICPFAIPNLSAIKGDNSVVAEWADAPSVMTIGSEPSCTQTFSYIAKLVGVARPVDGVQLCPAIFCSIDDGVERSK